METAGLELAEALAEAQKLGYAEADPSADLESRDALAKIVILANVLLEARPQARLDQSLRHRRHHGP